MHPNLPLLVTGHWVQLWGLLGLGLSRGRLVTIARAWAHSAPPMGIPNLPPFPIQPNFRLPLMWTHSPHTKDQKAPSPPSPSFCPKTPHVQSTRAAPKIPLRQQNPSGVTRQVLPREQVLCFSLHKSNSFSTARREVCWLLAKFHYMHFYIQIEASSKTHRAKKAF